MPVYAFAKSTFKCPSPKKFISIIENSARGKYSKDLWKDFYKVYKTYPRQKCNDVELSMAWEGEIINVLENHWNIIGGIAELKPRDENFETYIADFAGGEESGSEKSFKAILRHAEKECPPELSKFCLNVKKSVENTLNLPPIAP